MTPARLAVAVATLTAVAAPAQAVPFVRADRNRDGLVTYEEARRAFEGLFEIHFDKCDLDGDGVIDRGEFALLDTFYTTINGRRR